MKNIVRLCLALLIAVMSLAMFSCAGGDTVPSAEGGEKNDKKEVTYTITEEQWNKLLTKTNYTVKTDNENFWYYVGGEETGKLFAEFFGPTIYRNTASCACSCMIYEVDAEPSSYKPQGSTTAGENKSPACSDAEPVSTIPNISEGSVVVPISQLFSSLIPVVSMGSSGVIWGGDIQGSIISTVNPASVCSVKYQGEWYHGVHDVGNLGELKWTKEEGWDNTVGNMLKGISYGDLSYDSEEKAYVHYNSQLNRKSFLYFENGLLVKYTTVNGEMDGESVEDIPSDATWAEDHYYVTTSTIYDYGKTKITVDHNFDPDNIVEE